MGEGEGEGEGEGAILMVGNWLAFNTRMGSVGWGSVCDTKIGGMKLVFVVWVCVVVMWL